MTSAERKKEKVVQAVLESQTFSRTTRLKEALRFMWDAQKERRSINQNDLARSMYGLNGDEIDEILCRVRGVVTKLRRRLVIYDVSEGGPSAYSIRIPMGLYRLEFLAQSGYSFNPEKVIPKFPNEAAPANDPDERCLPSTCPMADFLLKLFASVEELSSQKKGKSGKNGPCSNSDQCAVYKGFLKASQHFFQNRDMKS